MTDLPPLNIHPAVAELEDRIVAYRRHFHQHPELGLQEHETARYILEQLEGLELDVRHPVAETGIVADLRNGDGPCVALRADMDALPVQETGDLPFKSVNEGVMHACGHDGHMAIMLGTLLALDRHRELWQGTVRFIFQPAEEYPGGAKRMIAEGALKNPDVEAIFGLHLWNYQKLGTVGVKSGPVMAAADEFVITVKGVGGHAAMPQGTVDAIVTAANLVVALQTIVSRNVNPLDPGVVTIGQIQGGHAFNVIADEVTLKGTARSYQPEDRELLRCRIQEICDGMARTYRGEIELDYHDGYPPTINDPAMTQVVESAAKKVVGDRTGAPYLTMGGEDMAYFLREIPGCFFFPGSARPGWEPRQVPHHCSHFDFDERVLAIGASVFVETVRAMLPKN